MGAVREHVPGWWGGGLEQRSVGAGTAHCILGLNMLQRCGILYSYTNKTTINYSRPACIYIEGARVYDLY